MTTPPLRRGLLAAALCALAAGLAPAPASAQDAAWPARPVRIVVPFPPGGAADTFARLIAEYAGKSIGQPVVAENRPGAGGQIATDLVAKAPADGHTFLIVTVGHAVNPSLYAKLPYDTLADLVPVARVADLTSVLLAPAKTPPAVVARMHDEVGRILALPEVRTRFAQLGAEPGGGTTAQTAAFLAAEVKRYATVVRDANMKAD
jgi:tripartite-type tricarboxylate transporter receptor subunit TctC